MATIVVTIPDPVVSRVVNGLCYQNNYQDTVINPADPFGPRIPNPESKNAFAKRMVLVYVKEAVKAWEATQAGETARIAAANSVETDIVLS